MFEILHRLIIITKSDKPMGMSLVMLSYDNDKHCKMNYVAAVVQKCIPQFSYCHTLTFLSNILSLFWSWQFFKLPHQPWYLFQCIIYYPHYFRCTATILGFWLNWLIFLGFLHLACQSSYIILSSQHVMFFVYQPDDTHAVIATKICNL